MRKSFFSGIDYFTVNFILLHTFTMKFVSYQFPDIHLLEEDHSIFNILICLLFHFLQRKIILHEGEGQQGQLARPIMSFREEVAYKRQC